jgi:hypothetical protein
MSDGLKVLDENSKVLVDTSTYTVKDIKRVRVTGTGNHRQTYSIPEIKADSIVVVTRVSAAVGSLPAATWNDGVLTLLVSQSGVQYNVYVMG